MTDLHDLAERILLDLQTDYNHNRIDTTFDLAAMRHEYVVDYADTYQLSIEEIDRVEDLLIEYIDRDSMLSILPTYIEDDEFDSYL